MILDDSNFGNTPQFHPTHKLFLRSGAYLSLIGLFLYFFKSNAAIDVQMHDTYLVISLIHLALSMGVIFLALGIIYVLFHFVFKIQLNARLSKTHYYLTAFPLVLLLFAVLVSKKFFISTSTEYSLFSSFSPIILLLLLVFGIGQILFLLNLILGVFRKMKGKNE